MLWMKVHNHLLLRACLLGSKRKLPPPACHVRPGLPSVVCSPRACTSLAPYTSVVRVLCQAFEPTAFLVHPVLAAIAEDAVAAHSSVTDSAWKLTRTLQVVQAHTIFVFPAFTLSPFFSIASFRKEPPDTFLERFSDDNKVIGIAVLPGDSRAELS